MGKFVYKMVLDVVCALVFKHGKVLAAQRGSFSSNPHKWEFPGGKVQPGELFRDAIIREISEELSVEIKVVSELASVVYDYGNKQITLIPFICKVERGVIRLNEHARLGWFTIPQLNNLGLAEADKVLLDKNREPLLRYARENLDQRS